MKSVSLGYDWTPKGKKNRTPFPEIPAGPYRTRSYSIVDEMVAEVAAYVRARRRTRACVCVRGYREGFCRENTVKINKKKLNQGSRRH